MYCEVGAFSEGFCFESGRLLRIFAPFSLKMAPRGVCRVGGRSLALTPYLPLHPLAIAICKREAFE